MFYFLQRVEITFETWATLTGHVIPRQHSQRKNRLSQIHTVSLYSCIMQLPRFTRPAWISKISEEATFPRFEELPREIRQMIWEAAIWPRFVHVERVLLKRTSGLRRIRGLDITVDGGVVVFPGPLFVARRATRSEEGSRRVLSDREQSTHAKRRRMLYLPHWDFTYDQAKRWLRPWGLKSDSTPPEILFVCKESFELASRFYTKCFQSPLKFAGFSTASFPITHFNFELDTLYIRVEKLGYGLLELLEDRQHVCENSMMTYDLRGVESLAILIDPSACNDPDSINIAKGNLVYALITLFPTVRRLTVASKGQGFWSLEFVDPVQEVLEDRDSALGFCSYVLDGRELKLAHARQYGVVGNSWEDKIDEDLLEWWRLELLSVGEFQRYFRCLHD